MPHKHDDSREFNMTDSRRVQQDDLNLWETVLKPAVARELRGIIAEKSKDVKDPFDLPRGASVANEVRMLALREYRKEYIELTLSSGATFDIPKRAAVAMSQPGGDASIACDYWQPTLRSALAHLSFEDILRELTDNGVWEPSELLDRPTNEERLLWIKSCVAREEGLLK